TPGPSVVRHAPRCPDASLWAKAAMAPPVSVAVRTNGRPARPAASTRSRLLPPPGTPKIAVTPASHNRVTTRSAIVTFITARAGPHPRALALRRSNGARAFQAGDGADLKGPPYISSRGPQARNSLILTEYDHRHASGAPKRGARALSDFSRQLLARARYQAGVPERLRSSADRRRLSCRADSRR